MSFKSCKSFSLFSNEVKYTNRYLYSSDIKIFLAHVLETSKPRVKEINRVSTFWRSQLGNGLRPLYKEGVEISKEPAPFLAERMKPLKLSAKEGRTNPNGIPHLYLSTD